MKLWLQKDLCDRPCPVASNRILGIAMELSRTISSFPHVSRFLMLTLAAFALPPSLPSQTPKELIGDACYNELQQRERKTLWSLRRRAPASTTRYYASK